MGNGFVWVWCSCLEWTVWRLGFGVPTRLGARIPSLFTRWHPEPHTPNGPPRTGTPNPLKPQTLDPKP